jgi:surfactin synthase thioesterase subunit
MSGQLGRWFQPVDADPDATARLFLFPCAGGNAQMYADWHAMFPPDIATQAVQFPGRLDRLADPAYTSMEPLIEATTEAFLAELDDRPYGFFGHSMGALLAYRTALALAEETGTGPVLIASAGWAPEGFATPTLDKLQLSPEELIAWVVSLGSLPEAIYRNPDVLALTIPPTRADLAAYMDYTDDGARMSCPVVTYSGRDDPLVATSSMASWAQRGTGHLSNCEFEGGHFFIYHAAMAIATDLTRHIRRTIMLSKGESQSREHRLQQAG